MTDNRPHTTLTSDNVLILPRHYLTSSVTTMSITFRGRVQRRERRGDRARPDPEEEGEEGEDHLHKRSAGDVGAVLPEDPVP